MEGLVGVHICISHIFLSLTLHLKTQVVSPAATPACVLPAGTCNLLALSL